MDFFQVELKKGQPFVAEVCGIRLGRGFTDSTMTVYDEQRRLIAENDDSLLHRQDPSIAFIAPRDGKYIIELRDSGYGGSSNNWYMLLVDEAIRPTLTYPLGGQPGQKVQLRMLGDAGGAFNQDVTLPNAPDNDYEVVAEYKGRKALSGLPFRVNQATNVLENLQAANNSMNDMKEAKAHTLPVAFNGIIERQATSITTV